MFGAVDAHDSNTDRLPTAAPELNDLIAEIINHAVDLFDHCLRQHLDLDTDFDRSNWPAGHQIAGIGDCDLTWDDLSESPISAPGRDTTPFVLNVQDSILSVDCGFDELEGTTDRNQ